MTKFKRPGKVEFQVKISEYALTLPRISVHEGVLYLTEDDSITTIDVLEVLARELAAQEGG